jgi:hypothetical protein
VVLIEQPTVTEAAKAEGAALENEAQRAKQKFRQVHRTRE